MRLCQTLALCENLLTTGDVTVSPNAAAVKVARRLADPANATPRWIGKVALRQLASPAVQKRLASPKRGGAARAAKAD